MKPKLKIYMAGPDVFLPDPLAAARIKKDILDRHGFEGLHPFDNEIIEGGMTPLQTAQIIKEKNCEMMRVADAVLANLTPFRGVSADVGTAFEIGFMDALGKPIFAYSESTAAYLERVRISEAPLNRDGPVWRDKNGYSIEDYGLFDNLMLGRALQTGIAPSFEKVVEGMKAYFQNLP